MGKWGNGEEMEREREKELYLCIPPFFVTKHSICHFYVTKCWNMSLLWQTFKLRQCHKNLNKHTMGKQFWIKCEEAPQVVPAWFLGFNFKFILLTSVLTKYKVNAFGKYSWCLVWSNFVQLWPPATPFPINLAAANQPAKNNQKQVNYEQFTKHFHSNTLSI